MKKTSQLSLLVLLVFAAFTTSLSAQDIQKEMLSLTKKYEQAYNKKDSKSLQAMYTKDATRTNADGEVENGNNAIGAALAEDFKTLDATTITIIPGKTQPAADGTVTATGSYRIKGKLKQNGEPFDAKGTYTNTLVKEGKQWKIVKSVLAAM